MTLHARDSAAVTDSLATQSESPRELARVRMTLLGTLMALFPASVAVLTACAAFWMVWKPGILPVLSLLTVLYVLPVAAYRAHGWLFPVQEGSSLIVGRGYVPWFGAHQLQLIYIAFPCLETLLRLVPGLFSAWLRLWGSRVGRNVYWTPHLELLDRGLLDIGDGVIFGHRTGVSCHIIRPARGTLLLLVRGVRIGAGAFIGATSCLGPGVTVEPRALVPVGSVIMPHQTVRA